MKNAPPVITLSKTVNASVEAAFDAWTDPDKLKQWFHSSPAMTTSIATTQLREGGRYRLGMSDGEQEFIVGGEYLEIDRPRKLVFSWLWEHSEESYPQSRVTVLFHSLDTGCKVTLIHEGLADAGEADKHDEGWRGCLDQLAHWIA